MSSKSDSQDSEGTKVSFINRIIYSLRDVLESLKEKIHNIILNLERYYIYIYIYYILYFSMLLILN